MTILFLIILIISDRREEVSDLNYFMQNSHCLVFVSVRFWFFLPVSIPGFITYESIIVLIFLDICSLGLFLVSLYI